MKATLPLITLAVIFSSCTAAYKSGQTPDDVYFSPERPAAEYVRVEKDDERKYRGDDYYTYEDDRYLRMKIRNRDRWSYLDDYYSDPLAYNYNYYNKYGYYNNYYYNPRLVWNCNYNPYAYNIAVINPKAPVYNKPRFTNLHVFDNPKNNTYNPKLPGTKNRQYSTPSNQNSATRSTGDNLRSIFGSGSSSSNKTSASPSSSNNSNSGSSSSSSNSGSSSSGTGGNAPTRKF